MVSTRSSHSSATIVGDHLGRELRLLVVDRRQAEEPERGELRPGEARDQVGGELAADELVVRQVVVEGLDDPVAVGVRVPGGLVGGLAGRVVLGVAGHVEPEPAPPLAVAGRGEQPVDQPLVGVRGAGRRANASTSSGVGGRPVRSKVTRRIRVRRSASGEGRIPCSSSPRRTNGSIRFRDHAGSETAGRGRSAAGRNDQNRRPLSKSIADRAAAASAAVVLGERGPHLDPWPEVGDDPIGQLGVGRHLGDAALVGDGVDQRALVDLARRDRPRPSRPPCGGRRGCRAGARPSGPSRRPNGSGCTARPGPGGSWPRRTPAPSRRRTRDGSTRGHPASGRGGAGSGHRAPFEGGRPAGGGARARASRGRGTKV